jgi:cobalt-zinc-cadmium resistance protein CzcA
MMLKGENSKQVIADIKTKIATIQETLPEGVVIEPFLDRTKMVDNAIGTVSKNLLEGALIVIFVLILFLGNLRAGLVVASVIPLSMLFAFILMHLFGVSGNLMSLGALDFGLLVDGAVIIVEAVLHQLYHSSKKEGHNQLDKQEMNSIVGQVSNKMMGAAAFGQIIILIVYLPILSLSGIEGKMFKPMAQTVSFALIGAFILSITYVPMMSAWVLNRNRVQKETMTDKFMQKLEALYEPLLKKALGMPKQIVGLTIALFIGSIILLTTLGGEFIPKLEEGDFAVDTRVLSGSSLNTTLDATQKASKLLIDRFPEIEKIVTKIGAGEIPTDPMSMEASDLMIILKDKKDWVSAKTFDALADTMGKVMSQVPGITSGFQYPVQMRFNELMTGSRQDVSCKIFGENLDSLAKYAALMGNIIHDVEGAKDLYTETVTGISQVVVHFNRTAIARYGANIKEVNQVIQSAYAGGTAGKVFEGDRRFDLVVKLNTAQKKDWQQIKNLMVTVGNGKQVPLYELAEVKIEEGPYQIQREDAARRIVVGFNVRGKDVKTVVTEVQEKVKKAIQFPPGYYVVYGGQFENLEHAVSRLQIAVPVALLLILVMLFFAFKNIKHCLLIFSAIPFSAIGGVVALWIRGMPFSISAGVGFIALFGVAVLNGIVLLTEMNKLAMEPNRTILDIIITATKTRLRPILITASVASLGFIPMALSSGAGAEVQKPLATVVIGGLLSATLLTLFVLPIFYQLFEKKRLGQSTIAILLCMIGLNATSLQAQQLTVKKPLIKVIEQVKSVSPTLKTTEAQIAYYNVLTKSSFDPVKLSVRGELGKVNSSLNDSKYTVEQVFDLPQVYQAQKNWYNSLRQTYSYQAVLDENFIKHAVEQLFIQLQFQVAKGQLLSQLDSMFGKQLAAVNARFKAGQDNGLEQLNMQNWVSLHQQLMIKNQNEQLGLQKQFSVLLEESTLLLPEEQLSFDPKLIDTAIDHAHPMNLFWMQKLKSAIAETDVTKSKILPQVAMGYTNQSFRTHPDDATRFNSVTIGLNIPLFKAGLKQKVKASQANETVILHEKEKAIQDLNLQIQKAWTNYQQTIELYQHIQKVLIPNASKMAKMANLSFKEGQISYIEWSNAMAQVQQIELQALESLELFNLNKYTLYYLLSK